ncbi:MAG: FAD-dependent oxidoreductase, partial [Lachnospiraceae bacterium]|nr:FAD-dependent oxidoreductase [Lachnospiraceae bacterium]
MMRRTIAVSALLTAITVLAAQGAYAESQVSAGTYTGTGNGRNGEVSVDVTVEEDGTISGIAVGENQETPAIAGYAIDQLPKLMTENQTLNVDSVAGATMTSNAIRAAVKDALEQAGADPEQYQEPVTFETEDKTLDTDIVIVGAGGSGMSAAIEAAAAGASVTVVESNAFPGGATMYSGGMVLYAATEEEAAEFGSLDAAGLQEGMKQYAGEAYNDEIAMDYLVHTKENIDWLKELYGKDDLVDSHDPGYVPMHPEDEQVSHTLAITIHPTEENGGLVNSWVSDTLYQAAEEAGAGFIFNTTADELLTDEEGKVCGIHAADRAGNTYEIHAKKVILASGGFGGSYEMLKEYSDMETPFYLGPTSNKGWGIEAGKSVNAKTA